LERVTLGHLSVVLAMAALAISLLFGDYERAELNQRNFYEQVEAADFSHARRSIEDAIRLWPSNARYYAWRGYCLSQETPAQCPASAGPLSARTREQVGLAAADYRHAVELNGRDAVAHHNLGWLDHLLGYDQEARQEFERAVALDPETAIYHLSLGLFLEESSDFDRADRQYIAAVEWTPAVLDSPFFARFRAQYPGRSEAVLQQAIIRTEGRLALTNDPILKARLGKFYLCRHDLRRAGVLLEGAARDLPNLPLVWFNLGEVRRLQGKTAEAWACYGKARYVDSSLAGPFLRIAGMNRDAGQRDLAIENLRAAARKWAHVNPVTAAHNNRLYIGTPQTIDDLLPTTLVWYIGPCEASAAYGQLAEMMPENKLYASRRLTCETLPAPHSGWAN
jgi:tetratricopeptide (TPR) repeat protein